jgi:flagellin
VLSASGSVDFQVGVDSGVNNVISLKTEDRHCSSLGVGSSQVAVSTQAVAQDAIKSIDSAISSLAQTRGTFGALENRLQTTIANIQNAMENLSASESRMRDVDVAQETANLTRSQILQQAGVSMLAQANQQPQLALALLRG